MQLQKVVANGQMSSDSVRRQQDVWPFLALVYTHGMAPPTCESCSAKQVWLWVSINTIIIILFCVGLQRPNGVHEMNKQTMFTKSIIAHDLF